ncbi:Uncharacterised protein [uncultured archaeon]|nr:Uncharacterised protein [uncultured archaeon]
MKTEGTRRRETVPFPGAKAPRERWGGDLVKKTLKNAERLDGKGESDKAFGKLGRAIHFFMDNRLQEPAALELLYGKMDEINTRFLRQAELKIIGVKIEYNMKHGLPFSIEMPPIQIDVRPESGGWTINMVITRKDGKGEMGWLDYAGTPDDAFGTIMEFLQTRKN